MMAIIVNGLEKEDIPLRSINHNLVGINILDQGGDKKFTTIT